MQGPNWPAQPAAAGARAYYNKVADGRRVEREDVAGAAAVEAEVVAAVLALLPSVLRARTACTRSQLVLIIVPCRHVGIIMPRNVLLLPIWLYNEASSPMTISGCDDGRRAAHGRPPIAPPHSTSDSLNRTQGRQT